MSQSRNSQVNYQPLLGTTEVGSVGIARALNRDVTFRYGE